MRIVLPLSRYLLYRFGRNVPSRPNSSIKTHVPAPKASMLTVPLAHDPDEAAKIHIDDSAPHGIRPVSSPTANALPRKRQGLVSSGLIRRRNGTPHILSPMSTTSSPLTVRSILPLIGSFREYFLQVKEAQELNKQICGNCYNHEYDGFVFVDELGERMRANYLTSAFPKFLESHGLRRMRFHDLRHSCASLLLANGVPMKQIQEWLGHSDFSTTANTYAHLDYSSKLTSADAMLNGLGFAAN